MKNVYLKPNVVIEPLFDRWYAWAHLISPSTAAMNIVGRHLKIMNSYIQAPQIHQAAVKNPKMKGGPFMDYNGGRVDEIRTLRDKTMEDQKDMVEFANAVKELDKMLKAHGNGFSLEPLYARVPAPLRGYVELFYDLNNHPSFRFFEPLLYNSRYYKESSQSIALWITDNDERPFCLSTPRLPGKNIVDLPIPFAHPGIDELCKMKRTAGSFEKIADLLGVDPEQRELFFEFFTEEEPVPYSRYTVTRYG